MNPSRWDKWPKPRRVRHVWVYGLTRSDLPVQGLVLEWKRERRDWAARVVWVAERPGQDPAEVPVMIAWVPRQLLWPVASDPNAGGPHRGR